MARIVKERRANKKKDPLMGAVDFTPLESLVKSICPKHFSTPQSVYHYTTLEALLGGIIPESKADKLCFWATDANYMNDPRELKIDWEQLKKDTKDIEFISKLLNSFDLGQNGAIDNTFLLSFSENNDSLPMWGMYGKNGDGVVLEFDKTRLTTTKNPLIKCLYPKSEAYYEIIKLLERVFADEGKFKFSKGRFFLTLDKFRYKESSFSERRARITKDWNT